MDSIDSEIVAEFLNEAKDLLANTEQCFLNLEKNPSDLENLNQIFRLAHNLKGSSGAVGFSDLADLTHHLESLLLALKERRFPVSRAIIDLLLRANDYLIKTIDTLKQNPETKEGDSHLKQELIQALAQGSAYGAQEEVPDGLASEPVPPPLQQHQHRPVESVAAKGKEENIRVSLSRIEKLLNNVGELSILQAVMVQQGLSLGTAMPQLMRDTLSSMTKIIKETQSLSMGLRMLPIKPSFQKMERIVRDAAKGLGKKVELHLSGEETEVDKTVLEQLADPLVHLVRNAIDHGLESLEERRAAKKTETGHIFLSASHRAGQILIEVRDDGRGLDPQKLIAKAKAKGLLPEGAVLNPAEAYDLIFAPGFSTKEEVSDLSGRGVGMDVVKTNITSLQGSIEIETSLGQGTAFRILLPLTLAIIDSVIVKVREDRFVIPLSQVNEFCRPQKEEINFPFERSEILTLREEPLPILRLAHLLNRSQKSSADPEAWNLTALIVREGTHHASAVMVDRILAQQQVVIKPLSSEVRGKVGVMGSAILGDGKPALILDLLELIRSTAGSREPRPRINQNKLEAA